jgi:MFS family permease
MAVLRKSTGDKQPYKNYLLTVLLTIYAFNSVDRLALGLLLQDIKVDLELNDTQLGFLTGIAFALFYATMGIPIARWADRGNRVTIISITTALWSLAVALCGLASSFLHLLLFRIGVAVGEAGCVPPAHSLIAENFTRAERPGAVSRYMLGGPLSAVIGYFLAGWLNEVYGWRATFLLLGLPGLLLAGLAWFTLRESRAQKINTRVVDNLSRDTPLHSRCTELSSDEPGLKEVFVTLWSNITFRQLLFGYSIMAFFAQGVAQWQPAFFIRSHGLETGELGTWLSVITGVGGFLGLHWGGKLATRYAPHNERLQLKATAVAYANFGIISACIYLSSNYLLAFGLLGLATAGANMAIGPLLATIQTLVPSRMRATSIAIIYLFANLIGMGLGPLAAGVLSDMFKPWVGEESLRFVLLTLCPGFIWGAWYLWRASKTVAQDLESLDARFVDAVDEETAVKASV